MVDFEGEPWRGDGSVPRPREPAAGQPGPSSQSHNKAREIIDIIISYLYTLSFLPFYN